MTFPIAGRLENKELTTNFNPSFLEITLNGLSALNALNAFKDYSENPEPPLSSALEKKSMTLAITTMKSRIFHPI